MSGELTIQHWQAEQARKDAEFAERMSLLEAQFKAMEERSEARRQRALADRDWYKDWHGWFAWRPVTLNSGHMGWLCTVRRRWQSAILNGWEYTE